MGNAPKDITPHNLREVSLKDKYELEEGVAYMSGTQALVRIPIVQRRRDREAGLNTAGFVSGYRGSPLAGYDREVMRAKNYLEPLNVKFHPGVNEDLAAASVWGTQQVNLFPNAKFDGVFGIWYGKAPGVDRSGDVFRHANAAGTSPLGGVLALTGDDHACKSSTLPAQSDQSFYATMIPMLYPASIDEFVEYGLLGIAMSRYSGCWTAYKVTSDTVETSGTVDLSREKRSIIMPTDDDFQMPPGGLNIRINDKPREMDWRLQNYKLFACHAFARKNQIDRIVMDSPKPRFGIITSGKSYGDVRQALVELGITEAVAKDIGLRVYKVGMPWPLEPQGVQAFCEGLEEILIVEEKREFIENQLKQQIFNWDTKRRPVVVGKYDEKGARLLPLENEQSVGLVARVIAQRLSHFYRNDKVENCLKFYEEQEKREAEYMPANIRTPFYCSGCPHNTSTKVIEGSYAYAGIGCHYMAQWMDRETGLYTHMGGEGVPWIGHAPFTDNKHVFTNLGDGTYFHSGILAIRASVAAKVNITYKILYNDAVAMTGGQHIDGDMPVWRVAQQMCSEGVRKTWIVTDDVEKYKSMPQVPSSVEILHRDFMNSLQETARDIEGCTVIIYDQGCAAEKRRLRKRGKVHDPDKRVMINQSVCEGCGDCSVQSNCISVQPVETEYGRKRFIHQTSCNKDFSCLKGFCPSFVTVNGGELRKDKAKDGANDLFKYLPEPVLPEIKSSYNILVAGIGGTGVLTVGALIGMAAHLEGKHCAVLDMTGLAQKGGSVLSHVRISADKSTLRTGHIISGGADLLLAYDIVAASGIEAHNVYSKDRTAMVVNDNHTPVSEFVINNAVELHEHEIMKQLTEATRDERHAVQSAKITGMLLGEETYMNIFMLGYAWQKGLVPISFEAMDQVIALNGVAVDNNKKAFAYGRLAAHDRAALDKILMTHPAYQMQSEQDGGIATSLDDIIAKRANYLKVYQDEAYAKRYTDAIEVMRGFDKTENKLLIEAVARFYHKVLAYKDEYEVARLYTDGSFMNAVKAQFQGNYKLSFHLAPPMLSGKDDATGRPKKREFGSWMMHGFKLLAKLKGLRGTPFDVFGYTHERREERAIIDEYEHFMTTVRAHLAAGKVDEESYLICTELLSIPDKIRGFGPIKEENLRKARAQAALLLRKLEYISKRSGGDDTSEQEKEAA